jgi:hypothetical protein
MSKELLAQLGSVSVKGLTVGVVKTIGWGAPPFAVWGTSLQFSSKKKLGSVSWVCGLVYDAILLIYSVSRT